MSPRTMRHSGTAIAGTILAGPSSSARITLSGVSGTVRPQRPIMSTRGGWRAGSSLYLDLTDPLCERSKICPPIRPERGNVSAMFVHHTTVRYPPFLDGPKTTRCSPIPPWPQSESYLMWNRGYLRLGEGKDETRSIRDLSWLYRTRQSLSKIMVAPFSGV